MILDLLRRQGKAKNSQMLDLLGGDQELLEKVREDLIFEDLAEDKNGLGLVYVGPADAANTDAATGRPPEIDAPDLQPQPAAPSKPAGPLRIFLSYGRKPPEHVAVARRLKQDLEARGHEVWIDEERLEASGDWEQAIDEGIEWVAADPATGRLVLLMTPHAVRRPDGYCLNEIARAVSRSLTVVPVMLVWCEPPLSICRIQWLDMRDCLPLEDRLKRYEAHRGRLIDALEQGRLDFEGAQASLRRVLDPLEFDADLARHLDRFTGRRWVFDQIDEWLAQADASRVFWITGDPGVGKTALAAWLATHRSEVAAVHFCRHGHRQKADPRHCVTSLAYQLATQLPDYADRVRGINELEQVVRGSDARTLFGRLIVQPLSGNFPAPRSPVVVLIDALDEATRDGRNELAQFLAGEFSSTPDWLRLVITSRPDPEVKHPLQRYTPRVLNALSPDNLNDIRAFLRRELKPYAGGNEVPAAAVETIIDRSEGNFLYADWVRQEVAEGRLSLTEPQKFPQGLGGVYAEFFARQFPDVKCYEQEVAPALEVFAAALDPLEMRVLARMFGWSERQANRFCLALGSLFTVAPDGRIRAFHRSLGEWLSDRDRAGPYFVGPADGHRRLAEVGWDEYQAGPQRMSPYAVAHLPEHLIASERWDDLESLLTDPFFLEAKTGAGRVFDLAGDFSAAVAALPADRPQRRILRLLEEALRRDIHFIARHAKDYPQGLFQCLWNNGWWYDCDEAAAHYKAGRPPGLPSPASGTGPEAEGAKLPSPACGRGAGGEGAKLPSPASGRGAGGEGGHAPATVLDDPRLCHLLEHWRTNKEQTFPGFPWLRCHRPPAVHLGTAQRAVLRGHEDAVYSLSYSPDGRRIASGTTDYTVRVWDAESGKCLEVIRGSGDVAAIAAGPAEFRWRALARDQETVIEPAAGGNPVARFPIPLACITPHPNGRTWADALHMTNHLCIITLEGPDKP